MKTQISILTVLFAMLFLSTSMYASDRANSMEITKTKISQQVCNAITHDLNFSSDMNHTKARFFYEVDDKGNASFILVKYFDKQLASEMHELVKDLKITDVPVKKGTYFIDVRFIVR